MPPYNIFDSDCESVSMGGFFNSLITSSINSLTPMCNDSASGPRVYSPTYPKYQKQSSVSSTIGREEADKTCGASAAATLSQARQQHHAPDAACAAIDHRPPLNPAKPKAAKEATTSFRNRKKFGLSLNIPPPPADPHQPPTSPNGPPRISCPTNVELRRKALPERHFFRPVSEDEESTVVNGKKP